MGAGQSDLYKNTYGDNIDNIPNEANPDAKTTESESAEQNKTQLPKLTSAQKASIERIKNTIEKNLKESDFEGTRRDLENNPVPKGNGEFYDHLKEMKQSYKALSKSIKSLKGSLDNPFLVDPERQIIVDTINKAMQMTERITTLFSEYGEMLL